MKLVDILLSLCYCRTQELGHVRAKYHSSSPLAFDGPYIKFGVHQRRICNSVFTLIKTDLNFNLTLNNEVELYFSSHNGVKSKASTEASVIKSS